MRTLDHEREERYRLGPLQGQGWVVSGDAIRVVPPRRPERMVRVASRPKAIEIDAARTALIVIDMQNDFVHDDGWFAAKGIDVAPLSAPVPAIRSLGAACRGAGVPVVWLNWGVPPGVPNLPPNTLLRGKRSADAIGYAEGTPGALVAGTWGAATIDALAPEASDIHVAKHRFSGFPDGTLESVLRNLDVTALLFAGVNVDRCVFATLMDASARGYACVLVEDACATVSPPEIASAVVWLTTELHGFACRSDALCDAFSTLTDTR